MFNLKTYEIWFITGSQHLYGPEVIQQVEEHAKIITENLDLDPNIPCKVIYKPVVTTPHAIRKVCEAANVEDSCAGVITWMHTFSPAKMWIAGLTALHKPLLHLDTQFNRDIPWDSIDMDFMNLNQSAHGDREYGFMNTRLRINRKVVVGHWEDPEVRRRIGTWMRAAAGYSEGHQLKVARFGDNMREVAVTEGDKVEAQVQFGWSISGYGVGDLVEQINHVTDPAIDQLVEEYFHLYDVTPEAHPAGTARDAIREQARIELGMRSFLEEETFGAFTTTFENLHGIKQLPGLAVQRLMADGYGFGAEGDWKTAALLRVMKVMSAGLKKGTSFMEDYTYHFEPGNEMVLGSHMLEVCPSISVSKPKLEVHPLGIGGKADPARLVFDAATGSAICASVIDMGNRFRLILTKVEAVSANKDMPKLPVARVLWKPQPSLATSAEAWILAGGAHHNVFTFDLSADHMLDWAEMVNIESLLIDEDTNIRSLQNELRWNEIAWKLR